MKYSFQQIDNRNDWDNFILTCGYASTFVQSWSWAEFQSSVGKEVIPTGIYDEEGKQVGAFLAIAIRAKRGKYLYIRNGPVIDWDNIELVNSTLNFLKSLAQGLGLWHVRISPLINEQSKGTQVIKERKLPIFPMNEVEALDTWVLDLLPSEEELLAGMRKNTRYSVRKAERDGVEIITTQSDEQMDQFFSVYKDTTQRQDYTGYSQDYIAAEFNTFAKYNLAQMFLAKWQGKVIAGAIFIYYGDTCYYHYSGALTEYRNVPAPYLIQWQSIKAAKERGLKYYNFWGIAPADKPNHPWKGLEFFKRGFGGHEQRWLPARDIPANWKYWLTNIYERIDRKRKGY